MRKLVRALGLAAVVCVAIATPRARRRMVLSVPTGASA